MNYPIFPIFILLLQIIYLPIGNAAASKTYKIKHTVYCPKDIPGGCKGPSVAGGSCSKGGALRHEGLPPCEFSKQRFEKKAAPFVAMAVPCEGGSATMFRGVYRDSCAPGIPMGAIDHYKCGKGGGLNGSNDLFKGDILTAQTNDAFAKKVQSGTCKMVKMGVAKEMAKNQGIRKPKRNPLAT